MNTDAETTLALCKPRLCELGKIKIGGKDAKERTAASGTTWRAPVKHDYFTVTTMQRDERGDLAPDKALMSVLTSQYGDPDGKLRQLPITLLSDSVEDVIQSAYVWYTGTRVGAKSDGKTLVKYVDTKTCEPLKAPEEREWKPEFLDLTDRKGNRLFKLHTQLNCVIAAQDARWGGVYKFRTTSQISASQLAGSLLHLQQLTGGVLRGLPLMLIVRPVQVAPNGKRTTVYVVHVELRGPDLRAIQTQARELAKFQLNNAQEMQTTQAAYRKLLRAPGDEEPADAKDLREEFQPEGEGESEPEAPRKPEPDPLLNALGIVDVTPSAKAAPAPAAVERQPAPEAPAAPAQPEPQPMAPAPTEDAAPPSMARLETLFTGTAGRPAEELRTRAREALAIVNDLAGPDAKAEALHDAGLDAADVDKAGPVILRRLLGECVTQAKGAAPAAAGE